jgi:hypothetical protein
MLKQTCRRREDICEYVLFIKQTKIIYYLSTRILFFIVFENVNDYVVAICLAWIIVIIYFIIITREVMLIFGIIFPVLIMLLKEHESKSTHRR